MYNVSYIVIITQGNDELVTKYKTIAIYLTSFTGYYNHTININFNVNG